MSKFTFTCDEGPGLIRGHGTETVRTVTFNAIDLDNILDEFELFLKGAGFVFDGKLVLSSEDGINEGSCQGCKCVKPDIDMDGRC